MENKLSCGSLLVSYIFSSLQLFFDIIEIYEKPWCTSMMMAPAELSFLYSAKGDGPKHRKEGAVIGLLQGTDWWGICHQDVWQTLDDLIKEPH